MLDCLSVCLSVDEGVCVIKCARKRMYGTRVCVRVRCVWRVCTCARVVSVCVRVRACTCACVYVCVRVRVRVHVCTCFEGEVGVEGAVLTL